jgi:hypothetical protein
MWHQEQATCRRLCISKAADTIHEEWNTEKTEGRTTCKKLRVSCNMTFDMQDWAPSPGWLVVECDGDGDCGAAWLWVVVMQGSAQHFGGRSMM